MPSQQEILSEVNNTLRKFNRVLPAAQRAALREIMRIVKRLDTNADGNIKTTVANLRVLNSVRQRILKVVLTEKYSAAVKEFAQAFGTITKLQNQYFSSLEQGFKPRPLLAEVRQQTVADTVTKLTEGGVGTNIADQVTDLIRTNITTGGSYEELEDTLRTQMTDTNDNYGYVSKYARQITSDALHQYNRNYVQIVSGDLGFEWYSYQGTDIKTTRPFCDAMTDFRYFHISQIPDLLKAKDANGTMTFENKRTGKRENVKLNPKTGLPYGMYPDTNVQTFLTYLGGYNCRHVGSPVSERLVKMQAPELYESVINSPAYKRWQKLNAK